MVSERGNQAHYSFEKEATHLPDRKEYQAKFLGLTIEDEINLWNAKGISSLWGIDIWGITVENEPHGNGNNWESMHYTPKEMTGFVQKHLGPKLEEDGYEDKIILGYDQNRAGIKEWVDEIH